MVCANHAQMDAQTVLFLSFHQLCLPHFLPLIVLTAFQDTATIGQVEHVLLVLQTAVLVNVKETHAG